MVERISSMLFLISLVVIYIPRFTSFKFKSALKAHIYLGSASIALMVIELILKINTEEFLKYLMYTVIMIAIGYTGYKIKGNNIKKFKRAHIALTIIFFINLYFSIKYL